MALAENLKEARTKMGITQEDLASRLGKSKNVISNWERGDNKPDADTLFMLCDILKVDANYLLGWSDNNNFSLSIAEQELIKKYRKLDAYGRKMVDEVLKLESNRCSPPDKPIKVLNECGYKEFGDLKELINFIAEPKNDENCSAAVTALLGNMTSLNSEAIDLLKDMSHDLLDKGFYRK